MSYFELIELIKRVSLMHPFVNSFFVDVYSLKGAERDISYGAISLLSQTHTIGENINKYRFNMIYADKVYDNKEGSTRIHSVGIDVVREILNGLKNKYNLGIVFEPTVDLFENQFADECSGVMCTFEVEVISNIGSCDWLEEDVCQN